MKPSLCVFIIAKNEARDISRCLQSVKGLADQVVLVDTGSTDDTIKVAMANVDCPFIYETYLDASVKGDDGEWRLQDFSKARNRAMDLAEATGSSHVMWMDADDELQSTAEIKRAIYADFVDVYACTILQGNNRWLHHRVVRSGKGVRFKGRCHEYLQLDGMHCAELPVEIHHDAAPGAGESSNARNLRILLTEWAEEQTPRTAFYIANTHRDAGRHAEAIEWYQKRIDFGEGFRDEWLFAMLYKARAQHSLGDYLGASGTCFIAERAAPAWAEFKMQEAHAAYALKDYATAIDVASEALDMIPHPTVLWRETSQYSDQPARLISFAHQQLGNIKSALVWAEAARNRIGGPDADWDARIAHLRTMSQPRKAVAKRPVIALQRPGAIGDVLMTLNLLPALREANPGKEIHYFTSANLAAEDSLGWIIRAAGADQVLDCAGWDEWSRSAERAINLVGYPLHEGYPEKPMHRHLLEYFGKEMGLFQEVNADAFVTFNGRPVWMPSLTLPLPKRPPSLHGLDAPYATYQTHAGWSKYKEWPHFDLVRKMLPDIPFVWIDEAANVSLQHSIALIANASMHIGIDSFANHLTNYFWEDERGNGRRVPGVILWMSTQPSAAGYPSNKNLYANPKCGPCFRETAVWSKAKRGPCIDVVPRTGLHRCADDISVEEVVAAVREMWERVK